jgi:hypothetical protein
MIWKLHIGIPAKLGSVRLAHSWGHQVTADPMMVGAATVFAVPDIAKSTEHYCDVLGFTITFEYGTPTFYVPVSGRSSLAPAFGKPNESANRQAASACS